MRFRHLIASWPSLHDFAADIGVKFETAKGMYRRDSIAPAHWDAVARAAKRRRITHRDEAITLGLLAYWHVQRWSKKNESGLAA